MTHILYNVNEVIHPDWNLLEQYTFMSHGFSSGNMLNKPDHQNALIAHTKKYNIAIKACFPMNDYLSWITR